MKSQAKIQLEHYSCHVWLYAGRGLETWIKLQKPGRPKFERLNLLAVYEAWILSEWSRLVYNQRASFQSTTKFTVNDTACNQWQCASQWQSLQSITELTVNSIVCSQRQCLQSMTEFTVNDDVCSQCQSLPSMTTFTISDIVYNQW